MISDRALATAYGWLWKSVAPMLDTFVRGLNAEGTRYQVSAPLPSATEPAARGLVSDIANRLLQASIQGSIALDDVKLRTTPAFARLTSESLAYIGRLEGASASKGVGRVEALEAVRLAVTLHKYFTAQPGPVIVFPKFLGCGLIDSCEGDVISDRRLYEVKAVDRNYRAIEVRQLLIYCALNHVSRTYELDGVGLLNPRRGICVELSLDDLCREVSGRTSAVLFSEIVEFATSTDASS